MSAETPYAETEAFLAVMNQDDERLAELLADMLPGELFTLREQAYRLFAAARDEYRDRRAVS